MADDETTESGPDSEEMELPKKHKGRAAAMLKKRRTIDLGSKGKISIKPGGLHRSLGIPQGQKIPASKLVAAAQKGGKVGRQARLAETMRSWKH